MAKKLDFKDFLTVDYAPGMPDLIKKNAKKRKMDSGAGTNAEYSSRYSPEDQIDTIGEKTTDPIELGTHAKNVGMGYTGKHKTIKDPGSKKGRHVHVFQFTGEEAELDEVSQALAHKVAKARQSQASDLRQKAVDEPDMMKAFAHTKAANKAEKKAGQSYNRLMKKEEVELDEVSTEKLRDYASAALQDKDKAKADKRWKYASKAMKTVGDREAKAAHALKYNKMEEVELDEALNLQQRRARGRKMKLKRRQIEVSRKRVLKRAADPKRLKTRAEKAARNAIFRRLAKGLSRDEVPPQRKQEIEKRMEKMRGRIKRLAIKLMPKVRKLDKERRADKEDK